MKSQPNLITANYNLLSLELIRVIIGRNNVNEPPVQLEMWEGPVQRFADSPDIMLTAARAHGIAAFTSNGPSGDFSKAVEFAELAMKYGCSQTRIEKSLLRYAGNGIRKNRDFQQLMSPASTQEITPEMPRFVNPLRYLSTPDVKHMATR